MRYSWGPQVHATKFAKPRSVVLALVEGNEGCQHAPESEREICRGSSIIYERNGAEDLHIPAIYTSDLVRKASSGELSAWFVKEYPKVR